MIKNISITPQHSPQNQKYEPGYGGLLEVAFEGREENGSNTAALIADDISAGLEKGCGCGAACDHRYGKDGPEQIQIDAQAYLSYYIHNGVIGTKQSTHDLSS
jgi:hypothetical protein